MLHGIRAFFMARGVLEVETPCLSRAAASDPALASLSCAVDAARAYLQTSPEYAMKRLLAAGCGNCFQVARVFRAGERGRHHNPEFTLLEWYRLGFDAERLMDEVGALIHALVPSAQTRPVARRIAYRALFLEGLGFDPLTAPTAALRHCAEQLGVAPECNLERDAWLDLLLAQCLMPRLPADQLTLLHDYPASQAALARLNDDGVTAARFEVFWGGLELANGYHELTDAAEQRRRFETDRAVRAQRGLPDVPADDHLLAALRHGLPECAGVALGLDRLLMKLIGVDHIDRVLAFPFERA